MGLAFKPQTDDVWDASSITIISELLNNGAKIKVYDSKAIESFRHDDPDNIKYVDSKLMF